MLAINRSVRGTSSTIVESLRCSPVWIRTRTKSSLISRLQARHIWPSRPWTKTRTGSFLRRNFPKYPKTSTKSRWFCLHYEDRVDVIHQTSTYIPITAPTCQINQSISSVGGKHNCLYRETCETLLFVSSDFPQKKITIIYYYFFPKTILETELSLLLP